ncbi:MAG: transposase [Oscillospiraceae bacterium]|nr:transposase [Oscillospiraceae bacterium]
MENDKFPKRKINRLKSWNYSNNGGYFITICTDNRKHILSKICVGDGFPVPQLTKTGQIVDDYIKNINLKYSCVTVSEYVIMPNHIHLLLLIDNNGTGNPSPTVGNIIGWFKYNTTKSVNEKYKTAGNKLWQRSYYDHIIRDEKDYMEKLNYILSNPLKWIDDEYYSD